MEFARVVKTPFERAFSMSNIKAGFAKCGIHPFDPNAIDRNKLLPSLQSSNSSADNFATVYPSSTDTSSENLSIPSLDDSEIPSVNPSPVVSSFSFHSDDGCSTPQEPSELHIMISTPVASAYMGQPVTPQSSHSREQSTPSARALVENPLVRAGFVPQHIADIFVTACAHELN